MHVRFSHLHDMVIINGALKLDRIKKLWGILTEPCARKGYVFKESFSSTDPEWTVGAAQTTPFRTGSEGNFCLSSRNLIILLEISQDSVSNIDIVFHTK